MKLAFYYYRDQKDLSIINLFICAQPFNPLFIYSDPLQSAAYAKSNHLLQVPSLHLQSELIYPLLRCNVHLDLKFGDGDGSNLCRVKKVDVSSTFIENIFRSGLTLVSSWDGFCHMFSRKIRFVANAIPSDFYTLDFYTLDFYTLDFYKVWRL